MAKAKKPAPSGKKGGNGAGNTTTIAERLKQQEISRGRIKAEQKRRANAASRAIDGNTGNNKEKIDEIFSLDDLVAGKVRIGNLFEVNNGSVFELTLEGGQEAFTLKKGAGALASWADMGEKTFVLLKELLLDDYTPRLRGRLAEKQGLMWHEVAAQMDDDTVEALAARLKREREATRSAEAAADEAARFVGPAEASVWLSATSDPKKFEEVFDGMNDGDAVTLRFGTTSDAGVAFAFTLAGGDLQIKPVHIGKSCRLAGKVLKGTYLQCKGGRLPETEPEVLGERGESITLIWKFLMNPEMLDRIKVRDPLMNGMYHAHRRLSTQTIRLATIGGVPAEAMEPTTAQQVPPAQVVSAPATTSGLSEFVKSLIDNGMPADKIGAAVAGYNKAMSESKSA